MTSPRVDDSQRIISLMESKHSIVMMISFFFILKLRHAATREKRLHRRSSLVYRLQKTTLSYLHLNTVTRLFNHKTVVATHENLPFNTKLGRLKRWQKKNKNSEMVLVFYTLLLTRKKNMKSSKFISYYLTRDDIVRITIIITFCIIFTR